MLKAFVLFAGIATCLPLRAEEKITEITATASDAPSFTAADGTGLYFDLIRLIFEPLGIKVKFKVAPWNRAVSYVINKQADLMFGHFCDQKWANENNVIYSKYPHGLEIVAALFLKGEVADWKGEASLENAKVAWPLGYDYHMFLKVKTNWTESKDTDTGLEMLDNKRMKFYLDDKAVLVDLFKRNKGKWNMDKYQMEDVIRNDLVMILPKTPRGKQVADIYNRRLPEVAKTGQIEKIAAKYDVTILPKWDHVTCP